MMDLWLQFWDGILFLKRKNGAKKKEKKKSKGHVKFRNYN